MVTHRTRGLPKQDTTTVRGIPVTSVSRTLLDLADTLSTQDLARAVHEAEVLRIFDATALRATIDRSPGRRGAHRLLGLLDDPSATTTKEEFDLRFLSLIRAHRLPLPQMHIHLAVGPKLFEIDALWPDAKVCVELDGRGVHDTRRAFEQDRQRDLALAADGYVVARVTWQRLTAHRSHLAAELGRLLTRRTPSQPVSAT